MTGAEVVTLGWLADFMKTLVSTLLGDRLKPKSSSERARDAIMGLYRDLARLSEASKDFVFSLNALAGGDDDVRGALHYTLFRTSDALRSLIHNLEAIDAPLAIHAPEVARNLANAVSVRSSVISDAVQAVFPERRNGKDTEDVSTEIIEEIAQHAQEALAEIESATETLRAYIAKEFSFKESF
jgi:hypothetical protein